MNGILNIYKEKGYTSHDAVARLRGITGIRRIGHTGTLDPDAEGVLPVCLGTATKVVDILTDKSKVYETVLLLGVATDTQDISGQVQNVDLTVDKLADEDIEACIKSFVGSYMQLPPMYSAVKVDGQKLCDIARLGKEVEREAREVTIHSIDVVSNISRCRLSDIEDMKSLNLSADSYLASFGEASEKEAGHWQRSSESISSKANADELDPNMSVVRIALRIECSKGTYIRTLCTDIGEKLGTYGCMVKLLRTRVGSFSIDKAYKLGEVEKMVAEGELEAKLKAPDACFAEYKCLSTKAQYDDMLFNGNELFFRHFAQYISEPPSPVRVYNSQGVFLAVYEYNPARKKYKPLKMFKEN